MRKVARVLAYGVAGIFLLLGAALVLLQSPVGDRLLRRQALSWAAGNLDGALRLDRVRLRGCTLTVEGLRVDGPNGQMLLAAERLRVRVVLLPLLHRELVLDLVELDAPAARLRQDEQGLDVARLVRHQTKPASPPSTSSGPGPLRLVAVNRLVVRDGLFVLRQTKGGEETVAAHAASLRVDATLRAPLDLTSGAPWAGRLAVDARLFTPAVGALTLRADGDGQGTAGQGSVTISIGDAPGGSRLRARGRMEATDRFTVTLEEARVAPALARALSPTWPLTGAVSATGEGTGDGSKVSATIAVTAPGARAHLAGHLDRRTGDVEATLRVPHLDPGGLVPGAPRATLALEGEARGRLSPPDAPRAFAGSASLTVPHGQLGREPLGPIELTVRGAWPGTVDTTARAALPGGRLDARARITESRLAADARLVFSEVGRLTAALTRAGVTGVSGRGPARIELGAQGPMAHLAVETRVRWSRLCGGTACARDGSLQFSVGDLAAPWTARGALTVAALNAGDRALGRVALRLGSDGGPPRKLSLQASVEKPKPVSLATAVTFTGPRALLVRALDLTVAGERWTAAPGARLALLPNGGRVEGLSLSSGPRSIALDASKRGARVAAHLGVKALDLGRMSAALLQGPRRLAGQLDAEVDLGGTLTRPSIALRLSGDRLAVDGQSVGTLRASVDAPSEGPSRASLVWRPAARDNTLKLEVPVGTADALSASRAGRLASLAERPISLHVDFDQVPLALIGRLARQDRSWAGTLTAQGALTGAVASPRGTLHVRGRGLARTGMPPTDVDLDLGTSGTTLTLSAGVRRRATTLGKLAARVGLPPRPEAWREWPGLPVTLDASVGPLRINLAGLPPKTTRSPPQALHGEVAVDLRARGTLGDPALDLVARLRGLALETQRLGEGDLHLRHAGTETTLDASLRSSEGGTLSLTAGASWGRRLAALVQRPPTPEEVPLRLRVAAEKFDLAWLSGISEQAPVVGGRLSAHIEGAGRWPRPAVHGDLSLRDGTVWLLEAGRLEAITVSLRGNQDRVVLEELSVKSGDGRARVTGAVARAGSGSYALDFAAKLQDFLIRSEGQKLATLSAEAKARGIVSAAGLEITPLEIPEAHLQVAKDRPRRLQPLTRPADVVLFKDGQPLNRFQAKKLRTLEARLKPTDAAAPPVAGSARRPFPIRVRIQAPRNLWVRAEDANIELGLSEKFEVLVQEVPRVVGDVVVRRGTVTVMGKRFTIDEDSSVRFSGGVETLALDVHAKHVNEKENVTVYVSLSGTKDAPKLSLTSDPPYPEGTLVTLLLTGRLSFDRTSGATADSGGSAALATSVLSGFLASQLQKSLGKRLPLDVLTIQPGQGPGTAQLEAGTYLTEDIYVAYVGRLGADDTRYENHNAVHLEYQFTPRWSFEGEYGDARTGSADLVWKKNY